MRSPFTSYNTRRSHMERDYLPPIREVSDEVETPTMARRSEVLRQWAGEVVRAEGSVRTQPAASVFSFGGTK